MGGTFDPVHVGHLILAEQAWEQFRLDEALFVPAGDPPHKPDQVVAEARHRYEMTRLAVEDNDHFECSTAELDRQGPSYTIDTIREILGLLGEGTRVYLLMGADEARDLMSWRDPRGIQELATIVVAGRPGCTFDEAVSGLPEDFASKLVRLDMSAVDISSTDIRERVSVGRSIRYLVPHTVEEYIRANRLYNEEQHGTLG